MWERPVVPARLTAANHLRASLRLPDSAATHAAQCAASALASILSSPTACSHLATVAALPLLT